MRNLVSKLLKLSKTGQGRGAKAGAAPAQASLPQDDTNLCSVLLKHADAARDAQDWPNASRFYKRYLDHVPNSFDIWVQAGHAEKEYGYHENALECYTKALEINSRNSDLHLQIGHLYKVMGSAEHAMLAYGKAVALDSANSDAILELETLRVSAAPDAVQLETSSVVEDEPAPARPEVKPVDFNLGSDNLAGRLMEALANEQVLEAAVLMRFWITREPDEGSHWVELARLLDRLGEHEDARYAAAVAEALGSASG